jgi:hypothetical protein
LVRATFPDCVLVRFWAAEDAPQPQDADLPLKEVGEGEDNDDVDVDNTDDDDEEDSEDFIEEDDEDLDDNDMDDGWEGVVGHGVAGGFGTNGTWEDNGVHDDSENDESTTARKEPLISGPRKPIVASGIKVTIPILRISGLMTGTTFEAIGAYMNEDKAIASLARACIEKKLFLRRSFRLGSSEKKSLKNEQTQNEPDDDSDYDSEAEYYHPRFDFSAEETENVVTSILNQYYDPKNVWHQRKLSRNSSSSSYSGSAHASATDVTEDMEDIEDTDETILSNYWEELQCEHFDHDSKAAKFSKDDMFVVCCEIDCVPDQYDNVLRGEPAAADGDNTIVTADLTSEVNTRYIGPELPIEFEDGLKVFTAVIRDDCGEHDSTIICGGTFTSEASAYRRLISLAIDNDLIRFMKAGMPASFVGGDETNALMALFGGHLQQILIAIRPVNNKTSPVDKLAFFMNEFNANRDTKTLDELLDSFRTKYILRSYDSGGDVHRYFPDILVTEVSTASEGMVLM